MSKNQLNNILTEVEKKNLTLILNDGIAKVVRDFDKLYIESLVTGVILEINDMVTYYTEGNIGILKYHDEIFELQIFQPLDMNFNAR